jgi:uncharacterized protein (DUF1501 family)
LAEVAYPDRSQNAGISSSRTYYSQAVAKLIKDKQLERTAQLQAAQKLPHIRASIDKFMSARQSTAHMTDLADFLEMNPGRVQADFVSPNDANGRVNAFRLYQQGRIALAAYKMGTTATAHITMGGFDTHSNHDNRHYPRLMDYLQAVDAIMDEAKSLGLDDSLVVTMGSDFGRTNKYNDGNGVDEASKGKDHWPFGSMMFIGNSKQKIRGNRIVGATDNEFKALKVDPNTLDVDVDNSNASAVRITPADIHRSLRRLAGIENSPTATKYALKDSGMDLFS